MSMSTDDMAEYHPAELDFDPEDEQLTLTEHQLDSMDNEELLDRRERIDRIYREKMNGDPDESLRYRRSREATRNRSEFIRVSTLLRSRWQIPRRMPHR